MKSLLMVVSWCLMVSPVSAVHYCKDYLENGNPGGWSKSLKTFEEEVTLEGSGTVLVDIWINDLRENDTLISGGFKASWNEKLNVVNVIPYNTAHEGPWDSAMTVVNFIGSNAVTVGLGNLSCVKSDPQRDIILAKLEIHYQGGGSGKITFTPPGVDTNVSCGDGYVYDSGIESNTFTIKSITTECVTDEDCDDGKYCNGTERCVEKSCQPGTDPCPGKTCNEDTNACESTPGTTTTTTLIDSTTTSTITPPPTTSTTTTTTISDLWSIVYHKMWGSKEDENLSLLRSFRDEVLTDTKVGRNYLPILYNHSSEVVTLLIQNPSLIEETKKVIDELAPHIRSSLNGVCMIISKNQWDSIRSLLTNFQTKANPGLKASIIKAIKDISEEMVFKIE